jgi:hypothetical protein
MAFCPVQLRLRRDRVNGTQLVYIGEFKPEEVWTMSNARAVAASIVGAVPGGVAGYLFLTDHGKTLRRQLEPALDDLVRELTSFGSTVQKAADVANAGWKMLHEALDERGLPSLLNPGQHTSPF